MSSELGSARDGLLRLFEAVEVDAIPDFNLEERVLFVGFSDKEPSLLFRGEGYELLRDLQTTLAGSALEKGGPSRDAIEKLLVSVCRTSVLAGSEAAIAEIEAALAREPDSWTYLESIRAYVPADDLALGACRLWKQLPPGLFSEGGAAHFERELSPPFIITEVSARDEESARLLARDRIDEAVSIFVLAASYRGSLPRHVLAAPDETFKIRGGWKAIVSSQFWDEERRIHPHYRPLSDAAAREEESRTDWERRVLGAARWYARAATSSWASEALTACMIALDTLFVEGQAVPNKGQEIANQVTERWVLRGSTNEEQRNWLRKLYGARNDAVHEARRFVEDLEVTRLVDLTSVALRWAAWHLIPEHIREQRACETFADVMADDHPED